MGELKRRQKSGGHVNAKFRTLVLLVFMSLQSPSSWSKPETSPAKSESLGSPAVFTIDSNRTRVVVRMTHSVLGRFDTQAYGLEGQLAVNSNQIRNSSPLILAVAKLQSLVPLRDKHMREYLEVSRFPTIQVSRLEWSPSVPIFKAQLRVRNVEVPITGPTQLTRDSTSFRVQTQWDLSLKALKIEVPQYMGVGVEDDFQVILDLWAKEDLDESLLNEI